MKQPNLQADELLNLLMNIVRSFRSYICTQVNNFESDLTLPQLMVVKTLHHHPDISLKDLSEQVKLAKSTTSGIVDRLVQKEMVFRTVDPNDRRNIKLSLNPETIELQCSIDMIKSNFLSTLLKDMEESEIESILKSLRMLNDLVERHTAE